MQQAPYLLLTEMKDVEIQRRLILGKSAFFIAGYSIKLA